MKQLNTIQWSYVYEKLVLFPTFYFRQVCTLQYEEQDEHTSKFDMIVPVIFFNNALYFYGDRHFQNLKLLIRTQLP